MGKYPSDDVARIDRQFAETEYERNKRLARNRTVVEMVDPAKHRRCLPKGECAYCDANGDNKMMPRHYASDRCKSGKRPHCTCDICY